MTENVLIFAGAGASTAVNPSQFPTTVDFFKRLPTGVTELPLFRQTVQYMEGVLGYRAIDIEDILWTLEQGRQQLEGLTFGSSYSGYLLSPEQVRTAINPNYNLGNLDEVVSTLYSGIHNLVSDINKMVYELYGYDPDHDELSSNWGLLLSELWESSHDLDIFTTNYDGVIENALLMLGLSDKEYYDFLGCTGARRKYLNLSTWDEGVAQGRGLLTKLHGSVDWKKYGEKIYVSDPGFTGDHAKHPIIYPGFKGEDSAEFFKSFHTYLGDRVALADVLIFVGFAFRDDYINSKLREFVPGNSDIIVINPDKKVKFPSTRHDATYLREGFGTESIVKALHYLKSRRKKRI